MTVSDLVMILLIANAVQNAMTGPDFSVQGGLLAAAVLLVANRLVAWLRIHSGAWGRLIEGSPTVLIQEGKYLDPALRKEGLERTQVEMAMREHGVDDVAGVKLAVLETDGSISIVPSGASVIRTRKHIRQIKR
jgi:Predicted membrane protein